MVNVSIFFFFLNVRVFLRVFFFFFFKVKLKGQVYFSERKGKGTPEKVQLLLRLGA
jgi:hypothetical protein